MQRITRQRTAILKSLAAAGRPLSIEEILSTASKEAPDINLSTIYRNLKKLIDDGTIEAVELPGEKVRYEISKKDHHHYFLCTACDKLFTIQGCPKGLYDLVPMGFKLKNHSIMLSGFCLTCA
jgi:Fur family transcriptional regulator, ferric uptake regulator